MKNKILFLLALLSGCMLFFTACEKTPDSDSVVRPTSLPYIAIQYIEDAYVYGLGNTNIINDVPDVVAIAVDTIVGFEGGYGGKTGSDSIQIKKSDIVSWPDTTGIGGYSITFQKFNKSNYKATIGSNIVIAGAIPNPGPTAMEGLYTRTTGAVIELKKVFDGVYVIDNPGGAPTVPPFPYLFYNYKNSSGGDSLAFPNQGNPCGGGLQLVGPAAPLSLQSSAYTAQYPPQITSTAPLTVSWKVFEFPSASPASTHTGAALCQWGTGVRTFEKQ